MQLSSVVNHSWHRQVSLLATKTLGQGPLFSLTFFITPCILHSFVASIWAIISMLTYRSRPCTDILALGTSSTRVDKSPEGSLGSHSYESESEEG
jgi:hypothetical protein